VQFHVIINPVITFLRNDTVDFYEGCLSLAGFSACLVVSVLARPNEFFFPFRFNCHGIAFLFPASKGFFFISIQSFQLEFDCCDQELSKHDEAISCKRKLRPPF